MFLLLIACSTLYMLLGDYREGIVLVSSIFIIIGIMFALLKGVFLLATVLIVFALSIQEGHTDGEVRAIAFSTLIIGNVFLILTDLSRTRSFISVFMERSKVTLIIIALTLLLSTLIILALNFIFNFEYPGISYFLPAFLAAGAMLALLEMAKRRKSGEW